MAPILARGREARATAPAISRVRPGQPGWPSPAEWDQLRGAVGGRLGELRSPLTECGGDPARCADLFKELKNPYFIGDEPGLAQTLGWADAWTFHPSAYAVAAETSADVAAAINFAREHNLRLVVKGGGHSYLGRSNAPDSLLVWTRRMDAVTLHDAFVPQGCGDGAKPQSAVTVGAGAIWGRVYDAVTTRGGRYVQGGGCLTVGVAGLVQAGGFGSFSKRFGTAAANLLEAEIVTADGAVRTANACTNPDLFWALKGGGGGSFGIVTSLTLKTHDLPEYAGGVHATIRAASGDAYRRLLAHFAAFAGSLLDPHWGEIVTLRPGNRLEIRIAFHGLEQRQAEALWRPFFDWAAASPQDYPSQGAPLVIAVPARHLWDPAFLRAHVPQMILADDRPSAPESNVFWAGNLAEAGHYIYAYDSVWLPRRLLQADNQGALVEALFAASRRRSVEIHFQKGLAGASEEAVAATRATATNPQVLDAFALAIIGGEGPPAYPGIAGHEPDPQAARREASETAAAMAALRRVAPGSGSYFAESNYFAPDWQRAYWGDNYPRLLDIKRKYDPDGLFFAYHGVGSEGWSPDG